MRLSGMAGFQHQGFVDPHFLACAFDWMLDDACHALDKGCPMAYFWFASSRSDLYSYWGPRLEDLLGQTITPASQQYRCLKAGLAPYPDDGISRVVIDTDDRADSWYGDPGMPQAHYLRQVASNCAGLKWLDAAVSNGVQLLMHGDYSSMLRKALRLYLQHTLDRGESCTPFRIQQQNARSAILRLADELKSGPAESKQEAHRPIRLAA